MQEWRTTSGAIAIILWVLILTTGVFGCGLNDTAVGLPDNYKVIFEGDRGGWIFDPAGHEIEELNVIDLNWQDWYIYGRSQQSPSHGDRYHWFILNTSSRSIEGFTSRDEWERQLDHNYIFNTDLKSHRDLRREQQVFCAVVLLFAAIWVGACAAWFRQFRRARQDRQAETA